MNSMMT